MHEDEKDLQALLGQAKKRERGALRNVIILTAIPIIIAGLWLFYTGKSIHNARQELTIINDSLVIQKKQLADQRQQIEKLEEQLHQATNFEKYVFEIDPNTLKLIASTSEKRYDLIMYIISMKDQKVGWRSEGRSPEQGFNSPSFAGYVLNKFDLIDTAIYTQPGLMEFLPSTTSPRPGDLVFYAAGYTMFYFESYEGRPFCLGMTPVGIAPLKIDFGPKVLGYGRISY